MDSSLLDAEICDGCRNVLVAGRGAVRISRPDEASWLTVNVPQTLCDRKTRLSPGLDDRTHCEILEECDKPHVQCTASKKTARQVLAGLPANKAPAVSHAVTAVNSGFSTQPPTNPAPAPMPFPAPVPFSFGFLPFVGPSFGPIAPSLGYSDLAPPTPTASPTPPHLCGGQQSSHGLRSKPSRETSLPFDILRASAEIGRLQRKIEAEEEEEEELGHQSEGLRQLKKAPPAEE